MTCGGEKITNEKYVTCCNFQKIKYNKRHNADNFIVKVLK